MAHRHSIHYHQGEGGAMIWIIMLVAVGALAYIALTPRSVGTGPGTSPSTGPNACNFQPQAALPDIAFSYTYPKQNSGGTPTQVAVPTNSWVTGQSATIFAGATSATVSKHVNGTAIPCPSTVFFEFGAGDGGNYPGQGVMVPVNKSGTTVQMQNGQLQAAVLAPTFSNGTSFSTNQVSTGVPVAGPTGVATAGSTYTFTTYINPGQGTYGGSQVFSGVSQPNGAVSLNPNFGGFCVFAYSNTVAIPLGNENLALATGGSLPPCPYTFTTPTIVPSGFGIKGWLLGPILNWTAGPVQLRYSATLATAFGGNTASGIYIKDVDLYQQVGYGGPLSGPSGYVSYALQNAQTGASLGYAYVNALFPVNSYTMVDPGFGANSLGGNFKFCGSAGCV